MFLKRKNIVIILFIGIIFFGSLSLVFYSCVNTSKNSQSHNGNNSSNAVTELIFNFNRQSGHASNQFALWIEDSNGQYIKTIYATRYTASGGWRRRETSLPLWVKQSNLSRKNNTEIDVLTSATPRSGNLIYYWDGTNSLGEAVSDGNYVIILEGTLRWENQAYYRAPLHLGQGVSIPEVSIEYIGDAGDDRDMINNVIVRVLR